MAKVTIEKAEYAKLYQGRRHMEVSEVRVEVIKTLLGSVFYKVIGNDTRDNTWHDLTPQMRTFDAAWAMKEALLQELSEAAKMDREERKKNAALCAEGGRADRN